MLIDATAVKIRLRSEVIPDGERLRGGDPVTLNATVTRIGEELLEGREPVSLSVDGWAMMPAHVLGRVSLPKTGDWDLDSELWRLSWRM